MESPKKETLLRIFIGEKDKVEHLPLYEVLVEKARALGLAGATVLRGPLGYGASSQMHTAKILRLSADLPLVIEIVDQREKIEAFLPVLEQLMEGGLVTLESVEVLRFQQ